MAKSNLSARAENAASHVGENQIWDVLSDLYHPETNPGGFVSLGVAENALMHTELADYIEHKFRMPDKNLTYGEGPTGSHRLKVAAAKFLTTRLHAVNPLKPEHIFVTNGVTSAIEHCSWAFCNPGDGFLLGQPFYRAFLGDISTRPGTEVVQVPFGKTDPIGPDCVAKYEQAIARAQAHGTKVRGLMLCHPHNPLGRCYTRDTIIELLKLCQQYQIHFVSDEIYGLSVWQNKVDTEPPAVKFESVLSIDLQNIIDPSLVHVLYGVSKDFGANGLRLGFVVSQSNKPLLAACRTCALYSYSSSIADQIVADLFEDEPFTDTYIKINQKRLSEAHAYTVEVLRSHKIEYATGVNAAFFLWINLGKAYLDRHPDERLNFTRRNQQPTVSSEPPNLTQIVYAKLIDRKIFLANGDVTGAEEPGWFRLVFSQPRESLELGLERIIQAIS